MGRPIIRLTSVTYAIRAQKLLEQQGTRCIMKKLAKNLNINGCGYGLEIYGNAQVASQIITDAGIRVVEIIDG